MKVVCKYLLSPVVVTVTISNVTLILNKLLVWAGQAALALLRGARSAAVRRAASPRLARKAGERRSHADKVRLEHRTSCGAPSREGGWEAAGMGTNGL